MQFRKFIVTAALLFVASNVSAKIVGDADIQFSQPAGHEELCATSQEAYQAMAKGTHPESLLVTCFINQQEWSRGEGAILYKVEIMRPFINRKFSDSEFSGYIAGSAKALGYVNDQVRASDGEIKKDEKKAIDELLRDAGSSAQYSVKKGAWQHVQSGKNFEIVIMVSGVKVQSNGGIIERDVASVMGLVNVKGKLLTLKVVNSKNEANPSQTAISAMRSWVGNLLRENALSQETPIK